MAAHRKAGGRQENTLNTIQLTAGLVGQRAGEGTRCVRTVSTAFGRWRPNSLNLFLHSILATHALPGETSGHSFFVFVKKTAALHPDAPLHSRP